MWTHFWDMNSGGGTKEKWSHIYIEAPEEEAKVIFYNRFGHSPDRVSCSCCGEDYSISEGADLKQLTGFHRGCRSIEPHRDPKTGFYKTDDPVIRKGFYLEEGEDPPEGYKVYDRFSSLSGAYRSLEDYRKEENVLFIEASEIKPDERLGDIPEQGYVWVD